MAASVAGNNESQVCDRNLCQPFGVLEWAESDPVMVFAVAPK